VLAAPVGRGLYSQQGADLLSYLGKRLFGLLMVLLIVAGLVFFLTRLAPGDPAGIMLGDQATAADVAKLRVTYGLDKPIAVQFVLWLREVASGNLGQSIFLQRPVTQALAERAEPTFFLALFSLIIAAGIGLPAGIASAVWRGRMADQVVSGFAMLAANIPTFWLGLIFIQFFAVRLGWFPVAGYGPPGAGFFERMWHLVLPACVLGIFNSALITRFARASMLDVLSADFVRTARAKGLSELRVVMRHAFGNALVPIITVLGLTLALLIGGAIVTETVFGLPGVGNLVVSAVLRRDYPVIQGALLAVAAIYVLINLVIDVIYVLVDPRVRY
jgi:peptide/nickel transport system permease protein